MVRTRFYANNLVLGDDLWIYAYKPDGSQWYCTDAIKKDNATYQQKGPFVPYIGTWLQGDGSELFKTVYNNFVYLPQAKNSPQPHSPQFSRLRHYPPSPRLDTARPAPPRRRTTLPSLERTRSPIRTHSAGRLCSPNSLPLLRVNRPRHAWVGRALICQFCCARPQLTTHAGT